MSILRPAWARRARAGFAAADPGRGRRRCPVCGSRVCAGDAIGIVDDRLAHAECAVFRWRGPGAGSRAARVHPADARPHGI